MTGTNSNELDFRPRIKTYFIILMLSYLILLVLLHMSLKPISFLDWVYYFLLAAPLFPVSYLFLHLVLSLFLFNDKDYKLKKVTTLKNEVKVAIISGIYNDFIEETLLETVNTIRKDANHKITVDFYICSDSDNGQNINDEKRFAKENGIIYIQRTNRKGQRPGAINEWARKYLKNYDYFMVLDKDSLIKDTDTLDKMVRALEHPENSNVAILQSSMLNANVSTKYSCAMGDIIYSFRVFSPKNDIFMLGKLLYWGHNGLIRKTAYEDVGEFSEVYLCDDLLYTMLLDQKGWRVAYCTDIVSYEFVPSDFISLRERNNRWARANLGTIKFIVKHLRDTSAPILFQVILPVLGYYNTIFLMMILLAGLFVPSLIGMGLLSIDQQHFNIISAGLVLYVFVLFIVFFARFFVLHGWKEAMRILKSSLYELSISLNILPSLSFTTFTYFINPDNKWNPFKAVPKDRTLAQCFLEMKYEFAFGVIITTIGLLLHNWVWLVTALLYIVNFLGGPVMIYLTEKSPGNEKRIGLVSDADGKFRGSWI